jgi:hypothetical protein
MQQCVGALVLGVKTIVAMATAAEYRKLGKEAKGDDILGPGRTAVVC